MSRYGFTWDSDSSDNVISVSDITDRFEELEFDLETEHGEQEITLSFEYWAQDSANSKNPETVEEYNKIKSLLEELDGCGGNHKFRGNWYPDCLIRDSYFETYAQDFAEDIGATPKTGWPGNHIDWEAAALELRQDFSSVDIDGEDYWFRN